MPFDHALSSRALSDVAGAENLAIWIGDSEAPAAASVGVFEITGRSWTGVSAAPAVTTGYTYFLTIATELYHVNSVGVADTEGDLDFIVYPSGTQIGDFAVLVVGWQAIDAGFLYVGPDGWTSAGFASPASPHIRCFHRIVEDLDLFTWEGTGYARDGGGWMMSTYRRGVFNDAAHSVGQTNLVTFGTVDVAQNKDHVIKFAVTTGSPTTIDNADVTAPYVVVNNLEGDNGTGQASIWSAEAEIAVATPTHTPPSITPSSPTTLDIDWQAFAISVTEVGNTWLWNADTSAPAATSDADFYVERIWAGGNTAPAVTSVAAFVAHRSGREECLLNTGRNAATVTESRNRVNVTASANRAVVLNPNNNLRCS